MTGSEWETFHQDLAADFGLDIDPTNYTTGTESVFDDIADSRSLTTYVSERTGSPCPPAPDCCGSRSLIWRPRPPHPGPRQLVTHTRIFPASCRP